MICGGQNIFCFFCFSQINAKKTSCIAIFLISFLFHLFQFSIICSFLNIFFKRKVTFTLVNYLKIINIYIKLNCYRVYSLELLVLYNAYFAFIHMFIFYICFKIYKKILKFVNIFFICYFVKKKIVYLMLSIEYIINTFMIVY